MEDSDLGTTERVLREERRFPPDPLQAERSNIMEYARRRGFRDLEELYRWAGEDYVSFWEDMASELDWFRKWDRVLSWEVPDARWFEGGRCNIVYNCLDRHMETPVRNKVAFYWEGENGVRRTYA